MLAKILYISDFHKRWKDSESVKGALAVQRDIQEDLLREIPRLGITHIIIGGDWYDRGFHGLGPAFSETEMDRHLSALVDGRVYLCVGNHFFLERDENPEMYIIQPNNMLKPKFDMVHPDKPIFQVVPQLVIGDVQIDFFHFSKTNKNYWAPRKPGIKFHIGIYHDDSVVPGWVREAEGYSGSSTQVYFNKVFENIDMALCGHIHSKIGWCGIKLFDEREVPMCIPGVMRATKNVQCEKHKDVDLPVLTIEDDSSVTLGSVKFSTYVDKVMFSSVKPASKKAAKESRVLTTDSMIAKHSAALASLGTYMSSRGYNPTSMRILDAARNGELSFGKAVTILANLDKGGEV